MTTSQKAPELQLGLRTAGCAQMKPIRVEQDGTVRLEGHRYRSNETAGLAGRWAGVKLPVVGARTITLRLVEGRLVQADLVEDADAVSPLSSDHDRRTARSSGNRCTDVSPRWRPERAEQRAPGHMTLKTRICTHIAEVLLRIAQGTPPTEEMRVDPECAGNHEQGCRAGSSACSEIPAPDHNGAEEIRGHLALQIFDSCARVLQRLRGASDYPARPTPYRPRPRMCPNPSANVPCAVCPCRLAGNVPSRTV